MPDNTRKANAAPRCQYVRLNDQRCTQPALHGQVFCRFHDFVDRPLADARLIPFVEDATSLQLALMQVIKSLQLGQIDRRTAGTILYALQIAASNLKRFSEENGHPYAEPARKPKTKQERQEEELENMPSFAEMVIERLGLQPPNAGPPCSSVPSVVKEVSPRTSAFPAVKDVQLPIAGSSDDQGGVIDKLEACDGSRKRRPRFSIGGLPVHPIAEYRAAPCPAGLP